MFNGKEKSVTKIRLSNQLDLEIEYPDSNIVIVSDSIIIINTDSGKVEIDNGSVDKYYESKFSFGRTLALTTGIIIIPPILFLAIMYNVDFSQ